jgi:MoxR-like ATPase
MPYNAWKKIDDGSEGAWAPDVWLGVIEAVSRHEGERVYDETAGIYTELEAKFPQLKWRGKDDSGGFRPYFRDFSKPWTHTNVVSFNETFRLSTIGRDVVTGKLSAHDCLANFCKRYEEDGEKPFATLAEAFLQADEPLSIEDIYFGVMLGFRHGDTLRESLMANVQSNAEMSSTAKRRLNLLLAILERVGAIIKTKSNGADHWRAWDSELLGNISRTAVKVATLPAPIEGMVSAFCDEANVARLSLPARLSSRFIAALLAKRFLILTGLSGSGKTKLAHAFASWLTESEDQYRLVAVGADWTTNENVVGYQDALQPEIYRKPSNGLLEVILRAAADIERPYFLILDEMNLSHVERYFADILSAIESGREIALHAAEESLKSGENDTLPVPPKVCLPRNLFIIGTVNVDETTYMFSPKVLDRANVIEFRATADDIAAFLDAPAAVNMESLAGKGAAFGAAFVVEAAAEVQLKSETAAELKARLAEVFAALAPIGAEFGFRTAYEITRFAYYHGKLAGADWQFGDALDAQVLQKLMPKLHGSQRRLEPVLKALEEFCAAHQCNASLEKIRRMQDRLKDGFTSFAEA